MRTILFATLIAMGVGLTGASSAAPVNGADIAEAASVATLLSEVGYVRRHGRVCYHKCYYELVVVGRRVCRTFC
jgi:hypothetical protein